MFHKFIQHHDDPPLIASGSGIPSPLNGDQKSGGDIGHLGGLFCRFTWNFSVVLFIDHQFLHYPIATKHSHRSSYTNIRTSLGRWTLYYACSQSLNSGPKSFKGTHTDKPCFLLSMSVGLEHLEEAMVQHRLINLWRRTPAFIVGQTFLFYQ